MDRPTPKEKEYDWDGVYRVVAAVVVVVVGGGGADDNDIMFFQTPYISVISSTEMFPSYTESKKEF
jgi:hypothetical protein